MRVFTQGGTSVWDGRDTFDAPDLIVPKHRVFYLPGGFDALGVFHLEGTAEFLPQHQMVNDYLRGLSGFGWKMAALVALHFSWDDLVRDPYKVTRIPMIAFARADKIGRAMGIPDDDPRRIRAKAQEVLHDKFGGSTRYTYAELDRVFSQGELDVLLDPDEPALVEFEGAYSTPVAINNARVIRGALGRIDFLTGAAGTGKTTELIRRVKGLRDQGLSVAVVAPTAKAAKRVNSLFGGARAVTIHRALYRGLGGVDAVVVDEASMVDAGLMASLLSATGDSTPITLIGDVGQLPPIGAGKPFADIIEKELTVGGKWLHKVHRSDLAGIVRQARNVLEGNPPVSDEGIDVRPYRVGDIIGEAQKADMVLVHNNEQRRFYNEYLRDMVNENPVFELGSGQYARRYAVGDPVRQRKNRYDLGIINGDTGVVVDASRRSVRVQFAHLPDGVLREYGDPRAYLPDSELEVDYVRTVHDAQGDEADTVVVIMKDSFFIDRHLLYTAITRAKKRCVLFAEPKALVRQSSRDYLRARNTLLPLNIDWEIGGASENPSF